jgi:hypothetical protein
MIADFENLIKLLSDLSNALRKGFHSSFSISSTVLKEGIVLPIYFTATSTPLPLANEVTG